ncbi:MAG: uracil-DNA glycosylase family protein [Bacteroidaceae bacterium]|nr:uracil-DNA glycosylase family protein [Bacteroidaceae bacterium]
MNEENNPIIEKHPWEPFAPTNARILFLGSFPPPRKRWTMEFYYPNRQNDFWKIMGHILFDDPAYFILKKEKSFNLPLIKNIMAEKGIALYDTALEVKRLKGNASDNFLQIITASDIEGLLKKMPHCHTIAVTGEKAATTLLTPYGATPPAIGAKTAITIADRKTEVWRMPSTSRAYPLPLKEKAAYYRKILEAI